MRKALLPLLILLLPVFPAGAQSLFDFFGFGSPHTEAPARTPGVQFAYDVALDYRFDNREFEPSEGIFSSSSTIHNIALTPSVGVDIIQSAKVDHRIMLGIDIAKNLGESPTGPANQGLENWSLFRELTLYYRIQALAGKTLITGYAGAFPRRLMSQDYGPAFFSDSVRVFDRNIEGMLLTFRRPKSYYEIGCDWMGMYGSMRRERFMIFSFGESRILPWLALGWRMTGYHYAHAAEYGNVCDNITAEPFVTFDLAEITGFQTLSARLGILTGVQRLRDVSKQFTVPAVPELTLTARRWDVSVSNSLYVALQGMMPFYNNVDPGGFKYGSDFYFGDPFFRIAPKGGMPGFYDRISIDYQPHITDYLDLRIGLLFHLTETSSGRFGFAGWQQRIGLAFDLDRLLHPRRTAPGRSKKKAAPDKSFSL